MRKTLLVFALILLTCGCILVPRMISSARQKKLLSEIEYRERDIGERETLTKITVALLYRDREIGVGTDNSQLNSNSPEYGETIRKGKEILEMVFGQGSPATRKFQSLLDYSGIGVYRNNTLVMIGDHAAAVGVVNIVAKTDDGVMEMVFEEKTMILLDMVYYSAEGKPETVLSTDELEETVRTYYRDGCGFDEDLYTFRQTESEKNESSGSEFKFGISRTLTDEEKKNEMDKTI